MSKNTSLNPKVNQAFLLIGAGAFGYVTCSSMSHSILLVLKDSLVISDVGPGFYFWITKIFYWLALLFLLALLIRVLINRFQSSFLSIKFFPAALFLCFVSSEIFQFLYISNQEFFINEEQMETKIEYLRTYDPLLFDVFVDPALTLFSFGLILLFIYSKAQN